MANETKKFMIVHTKSKKMNNFMLDLQIVNDDKEELKKRLKEILTKMIFNGDKKEIIAYTDFELWQFAKMEENYTNFEIERKKLFDYEEILKETKLEILEKLKEEEK